MNKLYIDYVEFYITNVCNLACTGCNRFNDRKFKGWQKWEDYKDIYLAWSKDLKISRAAIMGGEPLLNSSIYQWINGLTDLWPNTKIEIASNGFFLPQNKQLYTHMLDNRKIELSVSIHNKMHKKNIIKNIEDFLTAPFEYEFDNTPYRNKLYITDSNGIRVEIWFSWWFHQGAIIKQDGLETLHNSDPIKAHENCHSKTCHHFDKGKLYKCGPAALFPEYNKQFKLALSDDDRRLMETVPFLNVNDSYEDKQKFLNAIKDPIPQCKFCPEVYNGQEIFAKEKKEIIAIS